MYFFHGIMVLDSTLCSLPWHLTRTYVAVILTILVTQKYLIIQENINKWRLSSVIPPLAHWSFWTFPVFQVLSGYRFDNLLRKRSLFFLVILSLCIVVISPFFLQKVLIENEANTQLYLSARLFSFLSGEKFGELSFLFFFIGMAYYMLKKCRMKPWFHTLKWMAIFYSIAFIGLSNEPILNRLKCLFWPLYLYLFCFYDNQMSNKKTRFFKLAFIVYFACLAAFNQASGSYKNRVSFFSWGLNI